MRDGNDSGRNRPGGGSGIPFGGGRHRTNGSNGVHPEGMRTRAVPMNEFEDPIDLVAVQADDELINALRAGMTVSAPGLRGYDAEDHVAAMLAAWKADVESEPIPELVDVDMALAAIASARPSTAHRARRHLAPVAAAAAFVVLAIGGVSVGSASSEPGDALWGVSKVLYSQRAQSVEAAARVETRIDTAKKAIAKGRPEVATQELKAAQVDLAAVRPQEGLADLADVQSFLVAKADETPPGEPTDPGTPLKSDKKRKVPRGAELTESPKPSDPANQPSRNPSKDPATSGGTGGGPADPRAVTGPGAPASSSATLAPSTSPVPTATPEGQRTTTTPSQGLGGAPGASTTASGTHGTS